MLQQIGSIWSPNTKLSPPSLRSLHRNANSAHSAQLTAPQHHFPEGAALSVPREAKPISQTGSQPSQSCASCKPSLTFPASPGQDGPCPSVPAEGWKQQWCQKGRCGWVALPLGGEWAVAVFKSTLSNTTPVCSEPGGCKAEGLEEGSDSQQRQHLRLLGAPASAPAPGVHHPGWMEHRGQSHTGTGILGQHRDLLLLGKCGRIA